MKYKKDDLILPIWENHRYSSEKEEYIDVIICGSLSEEDSLCLKTLLNKAPNESIAHHSPHAPEFLSKHTEKNGDSYYVGVNCLQKAVKSRTMVNTLNNFNEVIQTPLNTEQIWFISPTIRDNDR